VLKRPSIPGFYIAKVLVANNRKIYTPFIKIIRIGTNLAKFPYLL